MPKLDDQVISLSMRCSHIINAALRIRSKTTCVSPFVSVLTCLQADKPIHHLQLWTRSQRRARQRSRTSSQAFEAPPT